MQLILKQSDDSEDPDEPLYMEVNNPDPKAIAQVKHAENIVDKIQRRVTLIENKISENKLMDETKVSNKLLGDPEQDVSNKHMEGNSTAMGSA